MIYKDITCPVCGCGCDDIIVELEDGRIVKVNGACLVGKSKFEEIGRMERIMKPTLKVNGKAEEIGWKEAVKEAARMLTEAERPLLYGWSENSCEAIKVGVDIAEHIRGYIDSQSSHCHGPTILGEQMSGLPTCTLGMVMNYSDLIVYWGSNPMESHPRHMSRFGTYPRGMYREQGRRDRKIIVIDTRKSTTAKLANFFYQIEPNSDFELISALRAIINGETLNVSEVAGLKLRDVEKLAEMLKKCQYGVAFIGLGLTHSGMKAYNIENLLELVKTLNDHTRFSVIPMRGHYNVAGFNEVLTWRTGYPFAVDFFRGYPRYNPGETSIIDLLREGEIDAMLSISADPVAHFPRKCVEHMAKIPLISIDVAPTPTTYMADLVIPGVISGFESDATYYRMDNVPLTARKFLKSPFEFTSSDEETLSKIYQEIRKVRG
ncbi:MAG: formylmethanofuran dehydrogenase subunit B [Candidatus Altiarchaeota archaeon]